MVSYSESGEMTIDYSQMRNKDFKADGYKVDESLGKGPKKERKCTDCICLIIFSCVVVLMLVWCITSYINGDPLAFIAPVAGTSTVCGLKGSASEDYKYLYIPDLASIDDIGILGGQVSLSQMSQYACCVNECPTSNSSTPSYYGCGDDANNDTNIVYATNEWHMFCVPIQGDLPSKYTSAGTYLSGLYTSISLGSFVTSMHSARWVITISAILALILSLAYIVFMDWCAYWLCWVIIILGEVSLILMGIAAICENLQCANNEGLCTDSQQSLYGWLAAFAWILAALYMLFLCCKFSSVRVSIAVIETAADFFADTKRIIFVPVCYLTLAVAVFIMWWFGIMCLASVGNITGKGSDQDISVNRTSLVNDRIAWMVIFYIWIATLIHTLNEYTVIVATCSWWWSRKDIPDDDGIPGDTEVMQGFWWTYRYNFGSLALGSGILTVLTLVNKAISYMGDLLIGATGGNPCTICLMKCVDCYFDCFDRFIRYLTTNAYIYMAISGESFCTSAVHAFLVVIKNASEFGMVSEMAGILVFFAKFSISVLVTLACWGLLKVWPDGYSTDTDTQPGIVLPIIVIFILSYVIASMFIGVFDVASNTILMCYLWDLEISKSTGILEMNHVPKTLAKFLEDHVHNKPEAEKAIEVAEEQQNLMA